jgi:hypothetical protein
MDPFTAAFPPVHRPRLARSYPNVLWTLCTLPLGRAHAPGLQPSRAAELCSLNLDRE